MGESQTTRRELMQAVVASALAGARAAAAPAPVFFTPEEFAALEEAAEAIIPADAHSPGAKEAQVAAYLDRRLAEAFAPASRREWKDGIQRVQELSNQMHGCGFAQARPEQRIAVLERMESGREPFFATLKDTVIDAYYTSKIGIRTELEYQGNVYLPQFVGYEVK